MPNIICACMYKTFVARPVAYWSTIVEFLISLILCFVGIVVNVSFFKKLKKEKQKVPPGRKGNVIEPIMSRFCIFQIFYWPYHLLFFWISLNEIIPTEYMNGWWCNIFLQYGIKLGRMIIGYNSLFVALIRYLYIVHSPKMNKWEFKRVGMVFKICSITIPIGMEIVGNFFNSYEELQAQDGFQECIANFKNLNGTTVDKIPDPYPLAWTLQVLPESIVVIIRWMFLLIAAIVFMNVIEYYLYFKIFKSIKR